MVLTMVFPMNLEECLGTHEYLVQLDGTLDNDPDFIADLLCPIRVGVLGREEWHQAFGFDVGKGSRAS